jgi:hypothetical protein
LDFFQGIKPLSPIKTNYYRVNLLMALFLLKRKAIGTWWFHSVHRKEEQMKKIVKILHIDPNWKITYLVIKKGILMKSYLSLEATLSMVKKDLFDLILCEPQKMAILKA